MNCDATPDALSATQRRLISQNEVHYFSERKSETEKMAAANRSSRKPENASPEIATASPHFSNHYAVLLQRGLLQKIPSLLTSFGTVSAVLVVTDDNVNHLYGDRLADQVRFAGHKTLKFVMKAQRASKSLATATELLGVLFSNHFDQQAVILTLGGGTVGDLGGFVAGIFLRGIRYIHIPTTLLSQADSCIGGKVNVNFGDHLNSVSLFYHPAGVWIDPEVLSTLPEKERHSGIAEIVKYAVVLDTELFAFLESNSEKLRDEDEAVSDAVTKRCLQRKTAIVSEDPKECGEFLLFNYGHEIGHAIEVAFDYDGLRHGEAVSIGMHASAWLANQAGLFSAADCERQAKLLSVFDLPGLIPESLRIRFGSSELLAARISDVLKLDKHRKQGGVRWILPTRMGVATTCDSIEPRLVNVCLSLISTGAPFRYNN